MTRQRRQEVFLDGIELSLEMASIAYEHLCATIVQHTNDSKQGKPVGFSITTRMLLEAWSIVDSVNRLRILIQKTPNMKRTPAVVSLLKGTEPITALRHFVQHLDERANEVAATGKPIWGSLSWAWATPSDLEHKRISSIVFIPGRLAVSKGHPIVNPVGKPFAPPVDLIHLAAGEMTVSLSQTVAIASRFKTRYEKAMAQLKTKEELGEESTQLIVVNVD